MHLLRLGRPAIIAVTCALCFVLVEALIAAPLRADDTSDQQNNSCKDHLTDTDPSALFAADMSCMDAATQYDAKAHNAALAGHTYDRDRYRLLAGATYVAAGQIETRIGDSDDAHDDFLKGAIRLKEAASSNYASIAQAAENLLEAATNH